ncbi:hypothetical protein AKG39_08855 [Acetobacterium bakii]|uniref:Uncharacterized protein n=2 Tax=Acetobacterium bakii TaxID=52689 RepID=A0A0L6U2N1_9FIRM|nr:hypothetical protein AKG39_08855 [Acetobacterium bakii]
MLAPMNLLYKISPKLNLKILYKLKTGYTLSLENPVKFTEKLQWIKLYERNTLMTRCSDKFLVRDYIKSHGCGALLNELYWEGFDPEEIPFDELPDAFVIKATHGSGFNIICENKRLLNREKTIALLKKWLNAKFLLCYGEWYYGVEKPRVIVEKYLKDEDRDTLFEYMFFCFHGEPRFIHVKRAADKDAANVYDLDFNLMPDVKMGEEDDLGVELPKPENLDEMLECARKLSKEFLHVRVDLYEVNGKVVFGELSFTKGAGFNRIAPASFDILMGSWLELPIKVGEKCWIIKN